MSRFLRCPSTLLSLSAASLLSLSVHAADVSVMDAYARAMPSANLNSAAFMMLHNNSSEAIELIGAESDVAKHVELHTHTHVDGVMQMRKVESIALPGNGMVTLKPGDNHIMLIDLNGPLAEGSEMTLTLKWSDNTEQSVTLPVKFAMPNQPTQEMKHDPAMGNKAHAH
jgi:copper(I)-binding protein